MLFKKKKMFGLVQKDQRNSNSATNSTLAAGSLTAGVSNLELVNYSLPGGVKIISKIIYAPSDFATYPGASELYWFNNLPQLPNAIVDTDPNKFVLPPTALIIGALLTNNGTPIVLAAGACALTVTPTVFTTGAPVTQEAPIFSAATLTQVNTVGGLSVGLNIPGYTALAALGSAGALIPNIAASTPADNLSIALEGTTGVASGDLAMILSYILY